MHPASSAFTHPPLLYSLIYVQEELGFLVISLVLTKKVRFLSLRIGMKGQRLGVELSMEEKLMCVRGQPGDHRQLEMHSQPQEDGRHSTSSFAWVEGKFWLLSVPLCHPAYLPTCWRNSARSKDRIRADRFCREFHPAQLPLSQSKTDGFDSGLLHLTCKHTHYLVQVLGGGMLFITSQ